MKVIWETMRKDILVQNVYILDPEILLTMPCKQVDSHYFLVCENGIVIIAVSLAIIFESTLKSGNLKFEKVVC